MPLGIVEDSIFEEELGSSKRAPAVVVEDVKGRGRGNVEVPEGLRKIIGENAIEEGNKTTEVLTEALGISNSSMTAYKQGAHSTSSYNNPTEILGSHINQTKARITKKATNRLFKALNGIDQTKLDAADARTLSGVAKDMSVIIKNMEPEKEKSNGTTNNTFILHAPMLLTEDRFEVIQANEP